MKITPLIILFATLASCSSVQQQPTDEESVPAGAALKFKGKAVAGRFWAELSPADGGFAVFKLSDSNTINRHSPTPLTYDYAGNATLGACSPGSTCVPPSDSVRLYTDQTQITYVDSGTVCHSNFGSCSGSGGHAAQPTSSPCNMNKTWCGPLQAVSHYAVALPDPVVQIANGVGQPNSILGCADDANGDYGLCAAQSPNKVDSAFSSLTSPAMTLPAGTFGCSYCYGNNNAAGAAGLQGLPDVLIPNLDSSTADSALKAINTDVLALRLANDLNFGVVITVYYALPALDATGNLQLEDAVVGGVPTCATADDSTTITHILGGGFGPVGECLGSQPIAQCDTASLNLGAGYSLTFRPTSGPDVTPDTVEWGDTEVDALIPIGMTGTGWTGVVTTPLGTVVTSTTFDICP